MDQWNHSFHLISFRLLSHFISLHLTFILHHLTFLSHFLSHFISFLTMKPSTSSQTTQTTHIFQRFFHMNHLNLRSLHLRLPTKKSPTAGRSATRASLLESLGSWAFCWCSSLAWKKMITTNKRILGLKSCETNWMASFAPTLRGYIISTNICCIFVWLTS